MIGRLLELPRVSSRQDGGPGGGALGIRRISPVEEDSLLGQAVEGGRLDPFAPIGAGMPEAPVVRNGEEDVGAWHGLLGERNSTTE